VSELLTQVASLKPGSATPFDVQRADGKTQLQVTPGVRPKPRQPAQ
jgi:S1-C subfamily serine protease